MASAEDAEDAGSPRRTRVNLSVVQKLELIAKLESGSTVARVCAEYGVKKQTVSDIRRSKHKLQQFSLRYAGAGGLGGGAGPPPGGRKHMKAAQDRELEEAVYGWYAAQRSGGRNVRGADLRSAANRLAERMDVKFRASDGWLWRFRRRHGIAKLLYGAALRGRGAGRRPAPSDRADADADAGDGTEDGALRWLDGGEGEPGYRVLTEREISEEEVVEQVEEQAEEAADTAPDLAVVRDHLDGVIGYIGASSDREVQGYREHFLSFREILARKQRRQGARPKLDSSPEPPAEADAEPAPPSPQASTGRRPLEHQRLRLEVILSHRYGSRQDQLFRQPSSMASQLGSRPLVKQESEGDPGFGSHSTVTRGAAGSAPNLKIVKVEAPSERPEETGQARGCALTSDRNFIEVELSEEDLGEGDAGRAPCLAREERRSGGCRAAEAVGAARASDTAPACRWRGKPT